VNTAYIKDIYASDPSAPREGTLITRIVEDSLRNIWFASDSYGSDGLYCFTLAGKWIKYADGVVADVGKKIHDMAADTDGSVWFGATYSADGGVLRFVPSSAGGQWYRYRGSDLGLDSEEIVGLGVGGGGLWFLTGYTPTVTGNGTGVHFMTLDQGKPQVTHYTYRGRSTTVTSLYFNHIAADLKGGVWFPAYDDPSIARLKADGSWQQIRQTGNGFLGNFGIHGVAVDSGNRVYFAPLNSQPVAYNATAEQWIDLPAVPFSEFYYYGVYVDPQDGKWFHGAFGVYYLDSANTGWTRFSTAEISQFTDNYVDGVLMDDTGNVWFMCRYGIALRKKATGGAPVWMQFTGNDGHGYIGGYRVYQDDTGHIWNAAKQKYDAQTDMWQTVSDTGPFDHRHLRFRNGRVPADMDMSDALAPISTLEEQQMTVDTQGTIYFTGGIGLVGVSAGIVAYNPLGNQFLGVWSDGVWTWDKASNKWSRMLSTNDASMIAAGRVDNDSLDDLIGVWSSGLYVKLSSTGQWLKLSSVVPDWIAAGDLNNDGRDDVIGTWAGDGTYYRDSVSGKWTRLASSAMQLASGNIGGTQDDLAGVWSDGLWVRYSANGSWKKIDAGIPLWITTGDMTGDNRADIIGSYGSGTMVSEFDHRRMVENNDTGSPIGGR
jgi:streptogramin lyase